jgi:hypothetical protein
LWNAAGAASSISSSAARHPVLSARILLICGLISWISCLVMLSRLRTRARRCIFTLLPLRMSRAFACRGSWILSASCPLVHSLFLLLYAHVLPVISFWLGRLLLMRGCLLVNACLLLVWCTVACALSRCRLFPCCPALPTPLPSLRACRGRSPSGVRRGPRFALFLNPVKTPSVRGPIGHFIT